MLHPPRTLELGSDCLRAVYEHDRGHELIAWETKVRCVSNRAHKLAWFLVHEFQDRNKGR